MKKGGRALARPFWYFMKRNHITKHLKRKEWERKNMAKIGEQKTITTSTGEKYILQHPGVRAAIQIRDRAGTEKGVNSEMLYTEFMEQVVFTEDMKRVDWNHFDEHGGLSEVMKEASAFLFRNI